MVMQQVSNKLHCIHFQHGPLSSHELIDTLSKGDFFPKCTLCKRTKSLQVAGCLVIQQVSTESSGGRQQADKILISTEALQPYLSYRASYLLALTRQDNDPFSTGISARCGGNNLFYLFGQCYVTAVVISHMRAPGSSHTTSRPSHSGHPLFLPAFLSLLQNLINLSNKDI